MSFKSTALVFSLILAATSPVMAHSPIKGIGDFYSGFLHPLFVPAHLLLLIALGLFIGQKGVRENNLSILVFFVSTVVGLILSWFLVGNDIEIVLLGIAASIGLLVVLNLTVGIYLSAMIAAIVGLCIGIDSAQDTLLGREKFITLLGSGIGINILYIYTTGLTNYLSDKTWQKIGIRIVASWIVASSFLVIALSQSKL